MLVGIVGRRWNSLSSKLDHRRQNSLNIGFSPTYQKSVLSILTRSRELNVLFLRVMSVNCDPIRNLNFPRRFLAACCHLLLLACCCRLQPANNNMQRTMTTTYSISIPTNIVIPLLTDALSSSLHQAQLIQPHHSMTMPR